jgi:hypothetical protein
VHQMLGCFGLRSCSGNMRHEVDQSSAECLLCCADADVPETALTGVEMRKQTVCSACLAAVTCCMFEQQKQ